MCMLLCGLSMYYTAAANIYLKFRFVTHHATQAPSTTDNGMHIEHAHAEASSTDTVLPGLDLAHLLGRGSWGWVYYGTWYGTPVAVKVSGTAKACERRRVCAQVALLPSPSTTTTHSYY
jgi:hypothetical protein